jgi:hypothetical protein
MNLKLRISAFDQVGKFISRHFKGERLPHEAQLHEGLDKLIETAAIYNNWFIPKFVNEAVSNIGKMLETEQLNTFSANITETNPKTVAVICAGNIPMVGFHDLLCVLLTGHKALIRLSSDDKTLLPFFLKLLAHYEPELEKQIFFAEGKLSNFDAIIATGSDNTASHLHYYFGKYPNIIRKSRTSLALLTGNESTEDLKNLGSDIFTFFGLGCRNVGKLLVPANYSFNLLFESIIDYSFVVNNKKYGNNYDYHRAIYLLEKQAFLDNNFLMIKESSELFSPVGTLFYQQYDNQQDVESYLESNANKLQCIIGTNHIPYGYSQRPVITDFADNVNTLDFLLNL